MNWPSGSRFGSSSSRWVRFGIHIRIHFEGYPVIHQLLLGEHPPTGCSCLLREDFAHLFECHNAKLRVTATRLLSLHRIVSRERQREASNLNNYSSEASE